jgi:hypothetical protein
MLPFVCVFTIILLLPVPLALWRSKAGADPLSITVQTAPRGESARVNVRAVFPLDVSFTAMVNGTEPISYDWQFGDGSNGSGAQVTHSFALSCIYNVTVHAVDARGTSTWGSVMLVAFAAKSSSAAIVVCPATGTAGLTQVELAGAYFDSRESVSVLLDGASLTTVGSDRGGSWAYNLTGEFPPGVDNFTYHLTTNPSSVGVSFTTLPGVKAFPDSGVIGDNFTLEGMSYPADTTVTVSLGGVMLGEAYADTEGTFRVNLRIPDVAPFTKAGVYQFLTIPPIRGENGTFVITTSSQPHAPAVTMTIVLEVSLAVVAAALVGVYMWRHRRAEGPRTPLHDDSGD